MKKIEKISDVNRGEVVVYVSKGRVFGDQTHVARVTDVTANGAALLPIDWRQDPPSSEIVFQERVTVPIEELLGGISLPRDEACKLATVILVASG